MKRTIAKISVFIFIIISILLIVQNNIPKVVETSSEVSKVQNNAGGTFRLGSILGANMTQMYNFGDPVRGTYYCAGKIWFLPRRSVYSESDNKWLPDGTLDNINQLIDYNASPDKANYQMAQSIAYAKKYGASNAQLQRIIWASGEWQTENGGMCLEVYSGDKLVSTENSIVGRAQQFANFEYIGLGNNDKLGMSCSPSKALKVIVDQNNKTYTAGPYMLNIDHQGEGLKEGGDNIANLVWREIVGQNPGQTSENQFCWGSINATVTFQNGQSKNAQIQVLDASGNVIGENFPHFGQEFYIRYVTTSSEDTLETIKPNINITYKKKLTGNTNTYKSQSIAYTMIEDHAEILRDSMERIYISSEKFKCTKIDPNSYAQTYQLYKPGGIVDIEYDGNNEATGSTKIHGVYERLREALRIELETDAKNKWDTGASVKSIDFGFEAGFLYEGQPYYSATAKATYTPVPHEKDVRDPANDYDVWVDENGVFHPITDEQQTGWESHTVEAWKKETYYKYKPSFTIDGNSIYDGTEEYDTEGEAIERAKTWARGRVHYIFDIFSVNITENTTKMQPIVTLTPPTDNGEEGESVTAQMAIINMFIGGNVWEDMPSDKLGDYTGRKGNNSINLSGIQVELYDSTTGKKVGATTTDSQGEYGFQKINPMHKYSVTFIYDGMQYEQTTYNDNLSGGYSTAQENGRSNFNDKFDKIESFPQNYNTNGTWKKAYGLYAKIENSMQNYIAYNNNECKKYGYEQTQGETNYGSFRYYDVLQIYNYLLKNSHNFDRRNKNAMENSYLAIGVQANADILNDKYNSSDVFNNFSRILQQLGIAQSEINSLWNYMMDTRITASTISYPKQNRFVLEDIDNLNAGTTIGVPYLYTSTSDQSRNVDFGLKLRQNADLWIGKDVYKATMIVNGKKQEYIYNKKKSETDSEGNWILNVNRGDYLFTSPKSSEAEEISEYTRDVRKSEYLYNASDVKTENTENVEAKNLQVYITYRIAIKNQSQTIHTSVDEIVDFYDADQLEFDGVLQNSGVYVNNRYKNYDANGNEISTYTNSYIGSNSNGGWQDDNLVVNENSKLQNGQNKKTLKDRNYNYSSLYLTGIKSASGNNILKPGEFAYVYLRFKVKNDVATGKVKLDQLFNNNYESVVNTVGKKNIVEINGYSTYYGIDNNNDGIIDNYSKAGVIDLDSNPGNLKNKDLDGDGNIIIKDNSWEDRKEDDTDKAPNFKLRISQSDTRSFSGYVFEDERNVENNKALVGDGRYSNNEKKINGVTVELVELERKVDSQGIATGEYTGREIKWVSMTYGQGKNINTLTHRNDFEYYSGMKASRVILSGSGIFGVGASEIGDGEYKFDSVPPGDFFIRFIYGNSSRTVLVSGENEVNNLLGAQGLNDKSYNGQDYKSTVYQKDIWQGNSYNGVNGYTNYEMQNFSNGSAYSNAKQNMYYYDIAQSATRQGVSDAKDIYCDREREIGYSKGSNYNGEGQSLKNYRAEILASETKLLTEVRKTIEADPSNENNLNNARNMQIDAINRLMNNTYMTAQTGVIKTEIEYDRTSTIGNENLGYHVSDIDLGLVERPEAQVILSKELVKLQIKLANGSVLFDTNQTINNLYFGKHYQYKNTTSNRLDHNLHNVELEKRQEELVYATMDEELISGATIRLEYRITVENIGEVDYSDKKFYYTAIEDNPRNNIATINVKKIVDYVTNEMNFTSAYQNQGTNWRITTKGNLVQADEDNQFVNKSYSDKLDTYNVLLTTDNLSGELVPKIYKNTYEDGRNYRNETSLVLSTLISGAIESKNLMYNNLVEVIETTNTVGRRMELSVSGNQEMPLQSADMTIDESTKWIKPTEVDADSAQRVRVGVPTGENKDYVVPACIVLVILSIIGAGVLIIKSKILRKK